MVKIPCLIMSSGCIMTVIPDDILIAIDSNESFMLAKMFDAVVDSLNKLKAAP